MKHLMANIKTVNEEELVNNQVDEPLTSMYSFLVVNCKDANYSTILENLNIYIEKENETLKIISKNKFNFYGYYTDDKNECWVSLGSLDNIIEITKNLIIDK